MGNISDDRKEYERVVLTSMMIDAANIIRREELEPRGFTTGEVELDWRNQQLERYLPALARAIPMEAAMVETAPNDDCAFVLVLPAELVRPALTGFLAWYSDQAYAAGVVLGRACSESESIANAAEKAASLWGRIGF